MQGNLTPQRAAEYIQQHYHMQITAPALSAWIKTGRCPFGEYLRRKGCVRGMYLIFPDRMDEYFQPKGQMMQQPADRRYFSDRGRQ